VCVPENHIDVNMRTADSCRTEAEIESLVTLLKALLNDSVINNKLTNILKMNSYPRHIVLSNWLEQLRRNKAPEKLTLTLACLFDDTIAKEVYELIKKSKDNKNHFNR
jgi:hypothetical protein